MSHMELHNPNIQHSHMECSSDEEESIVSERAADEAINSSYGIPERSKLVYETCYNSFCEWLNESKIQTVTEKVMLTYFLHQSKVKKSSTLWSNYSKLKCMIYMKRKVDIGRFSSVTTFLKRKSAGYETKKSAILTKSDFDRFIDEADDYEYLMMKTALVIGIAGCCRRDELLKLSIRDVVDWGDYIQIDIVDAKTHIAKQFVITESSDGNEKLMGVIRKYVSLRNPATPHDRFFVGLRKGKCTTQPVGINTIGAIPKNVARFLGLVDVEQYTGHCFRRSSPKVLAESGGEFSVFKRHDVEGLRRMIPFKQQGESEPRRISTDGKLQLKTEPTSANERESFGDTDFQLQVDEQVEASGEQAKQDAQYGFSIRYSVPSTVTTQEQHLTQPHPDEPSGSRPQTSKDASRTLTSTFQQTDESDLDNQMHDEEEEIFPDKGNPFLLSTREKIENLRLQEMQNRVTESRLRCEVQKMIVSKAEEEFKHLQEMNKLQLQEAEMRLKLLEQKSANERGNLESL